MFKATAIRVLLIGAALVIGGCSSGVTDTTEPAVLLSVSPAGGAVGVSTTPDVVFRFSGPMMSGMEQYAALHQGGLNAPTMPMTCTWSDNGQTLTCRPTQPLDALTPCTIHLGGGMLDAEGRPLGLSGHGPGMGGQWVTGGMMGAQSGMMGTGWMTPGGGGYGMMFGFTTR